MLERTIVSPNAVNQHPRGGRSHLVSRLVDRGKSRIGQLGDVQIVEPDDRHIVRTAQACVGDGLQGSESDHVVGGNDRSRARKHAE